MRFIRICTKAPGFVKSSHLLRKENESGELQLFWQEGGLLCRKVWEKKKTCETESESGVNERFSHHSFHSCAPATKRRVLMCRNKEEKGEFVHFVSSEFGWREGRNCGQKTNFFFLFFFLEFNYCPPLPLRSLPARLQPSL